MTDHEWLAAADELHADECREPDCGGRAEHEQRHRVSYLAALAVDENLVRRMQRATDPSQGVPSPNHVGAFLALSASVGLSIAQGVVGDPSVLSILSPTLSGVVLGVAQVIVVLVAAYRVQPRTK